MMKNIVAPSSSQHAVSLLIQFYKLIYSMILKNENEYKYNQKILELRNYVRQE